jgi:hypothetical protein
MVRYAPCGPTTFGAVAPRESKCTKTPRCVVSPVERFTSSVPPTADGVIAPAGTVAMIWPSVQLPAATVSGMTVAFPLGSRTSMLTVPAAAPKP